MNQKNSLRNYLIKYFLIILSLVGLTELGLNFLYHNIVYPWLEQVYDISRFLSNSTLSESIAIFFSGVFWLIFKGLTDLIPWNNYLTTTASQQFENQLFGKFLQNATTMSPTESKIYLTGIFCLFFLMFILWLLPYLLAAISFGILVSKKAAALEAEKLSLQQNYEQQRNLLLSDVAHDLKTPMTTIVGYTSALREGSVDSPEKKQEYLDTIYHKSMQMNELLLLLFEYVKLDSAGFSLKKEDVDLCELLRECISVFYTDFEEKNMEVSIDIPETPILFSADRIQFERAIHNLMANALAHNPPGTKVSISICKRAYVLFISIRDSGNVIPEETAAHLFEPFVQGDASRNSKSGSGLGLSITEKIISMHGGTIALNQDAQNDFTKSFVITLKNEHPDY